MAWYYRVGRRVWPPELTGFLFRERRADGGPTVGELWGEPQEHEERPNVIERPRPPPRLEARGERQAAATAF